MELSRRGVMKLTAAAGAVAMWPASLAAQPSMTPMHGFSRYGDLKYPEDFTHFDYINPDAPKGGKMVTLASNWNYNQDQNSYNSFNTFIFKGNGPVKMHQFCYGTLMRYAYDTPDQYYGYIAETVEVDKENKFAYFNLRPEARFSDGSQITADDVVFSIAILKDKGHPLIKNFLLNVGQGTAESKTRVKVQLLGESMNDALMSISNMEILPKAYYEVNDFEESGFVIPVTSGPYTIGNYDAGKYIEYKKLPDFWAENLPALKGQNNFDVVRYEFYQDSTASFEAFKKGEITFYQDYSSKNWSTAYNFPALVRGDVIRETIPNPGPRGAQNFYLNNRIKKFSNPLVREALGYLFDFEWTNKNLFYGLYARRNGFFVGGALEAIGYPSQGELALLEPYRDQLDPRVFGEAIQPPVSDGTGRDRKMLQAAVKLFEQAGLKKDGNTLLDEDGNPFTIEFLETSPSFERIMLPIINNLERVGIEANFRLVDSSQYVLRVDSFEFEVVSRAYGYGDTMSTGTYDQWHSDFADQAGSSNISGINNPIVDELLEIAIAAQTRTEMQVASRALDRVLRSEFYVIPAWFKDVETVAYWDRYSYHDVIPDYGFEPEFWWWETPAVTET